MKFKLPKFTFPWNRPSGKEALEAIFSEFTAEELSLLNEKCSYMPNMYAILMRESYALKTRRSLEDVKRVAAKYIYPLRDQLEDSEIQRKVLFILAWGIFSPGEYRYF